MFIHKKNLPCRGGQGINHGSYKKYARFEPFLEARRVGLSILKEYDYV
jgi:hypothetical protein